jgi:DNA-binding CsgD family transcriptional regulator
MDVVLRQALEAARHLSDPQPPWDAILRTGARLVGADGGVFLSFEDGRVTSMHQFATDASAGRAYAEHYHREDVLVCAPQRAEGAWLNTQTVMSAAVRSRTPYYTDFMCRHRMRQLFSFIVEDRGAHVVSLGFQRETASDVLDEKLASPEIAAYSRELRQNVERRRAAAQQWLLSAESAFDLVDEAILVVDRRGQLIHLSAPAAGQLNRSACFELRRNTLWHRDASVRERLHQALSADALPVRLHVNDPAGRCWYVDIASAPALLGLGTLPLRFLRLGLAARAMPSSEELCQAFDITPAEARVLLALMNGKTARQHAQERGVSVHTVRTQIYNLTSKLGCSRQVDLVRKALALVAT